MSQEKRKKLQDARHKAEAVPPTPTPTPPPSPPFCLSLAGGEIRLLAQGYVPRPGAVPTQS